MLRLHRSEKGSVLVAVEELNRKTRFVTHGFALANECRDKSLLAAMDAAAIMVALLACASDCDLCEVSRWCLPNPLGLFRTATPVLCRPQTNIQPSGLHPFQSRATQRLNGCETPAANQNVPVHFYMNGTEGCFRANSKTNARHCFSFHNTTAAFIEHHVYRRLQR